MNTRCRARRTAVPWRCLQPAVHHHQMRLARGVATSRTLSSGSSSSTVPMPVSTAQARARQAWLSARGRCRDPLTGAVGQRRHAVQRPRPSCVPRRAAHHAAEKPMFSRAPVRARPHQTSTPRRAAAQSSGPPPGVGVGNAGHHAPHARLYQRIAARPRAPLVRAGFQRHIAVAPRTSWRAAHRAAPLPRHAGRRACWVKPGQARRRRRAAITQPTRGFRVEDKAPGLRAQAPAG